jgi:hypothetical protein
MSTLRLQVQKAVFASLLATLLMGQPVRGQQPIPPAPFSYPSVPATPSTQGPGMYPYGTDQYGEGYAPQTTEEGMAPSYPGAGEGAGGAGVGTGAGVGAGAAPAYASLGSAFTPGAFGTGAAGTVAIADNVGYIDSAIIRSRIRVRYDSAYDFNSPDKAEFFYAKCGCFANPKNFLTNGMFIPKNAFAMGYDPHARGPQHFPIVPPANPAFSRGFTGDPSINYQELATYLEYAPVRNFSSFIELPARFLNPTLVPNYYGFSDLNLGFKYAFVAQPNEYYTFQFRTYVPTGAPDRGLGTGHPTLEPALLVFQRLTDRLYFSGEFRDWIPVDGSNFAGNILRYGAGLTYNIVLTSRFRVAPVNEVVGWSILGGKELVPNPSQFGGIVKSVGGQCIVNEKIGLRFGLGNYNQPGGGSALNDRHSLYVGYGQAMTGDHWYKHDLRVEYNFWF